MELKDPKQNADGSFSLIADGNTIKLVRESDLLAVKGGAGQKEAELYSKVAESNRQAEEFRQQLLKEQARQSEFELKLKELPSIQQKLTDATKLTETHVNRVKELESRVLDFTKNSLMQGYGVKPEALKDKTLDDISKMEQAFVSSGVPKRGVVTYDTGTGGNTGNPSGYRSLADRKEEKGIK